MIQTLIGQKKDQTQKFLEDGKRIPVTHISVVANNVLQIKTTANDGYESIQLGFGKKKKPTKPAVGHSKKAGLETVPAFIHEVRVTKADEEEYPQLGSLITVSSVFKPGDIVSVTGTSKGKGFAGVVKRHGFRGGPKTHGQSDRHRAPGAIGQGTTPGRVYKGKRMAGHMGVETTTITGLIVLAVNDEKGELLVKGLVPGSKEGMVFITKTGEVKKFVDLLEVVTARVAQEAADAEKARIEAEKTAQETIAEAVTETEKTAESQEQSAESSKEEAKEEKTSTTEGEVKEEVTEESVENEKEETKEADVKEEK